MDLNKSFDNISPVKLLYTLKSKGINNKSHKLFESYLKNREQQVKICNIHVDELKITIKVL
jgi:hypothetical protein